MTIQTNQTSSTTTIYINSNKFLHTNSESTILQACDAKGLSIPRFCYNELLSIAGNCRMCLIEIENHAKLMPSCAIKIVDGMKIYTKTNLVKKTRESILEFLLINHPLDCPICDQGGECDLQDQALIYGSDRGRFNEYKRSVEEKNGGPIIKTIMTRCIHCTRCIRFATEITGIETYGTSGRGKNMEVGTYISKLFESELSGNVIDLCPVGALTSKPYAFTVRPWELKSTESIDILDGIGSRIRIDTKGSELMRILPSTNVYNSFSTQEWISDKTRFSYDGLKCQRLGNPMLLIDGKHVSVSWRKAFETIKEEILNKKEDKTAGLSASRRWKHLGKRNYQYKTIKGCIGHLVDVETILFYKRLLHKSGNNDLTVENISNKQICVDYRSDYLVSNDMLCVEPHKKINVDYLLLIGTNPRLEASLFNVHLRKLTVSDRNTNITIANIGSPSNLSYPINHLGKGVKTLFLIAIGKHKILNKYLTTSNPQFLLGSSLYQRTDFTSLRSMANSISLLHTRVAQATQQKSKNHSILTKFARLGPTSAPVVTHKFDGVNTLQAHAAVAGAWDLAFCNSRNQQSLGSRPNSDVQDISYLLGVNQWPDSTGSFIIYQSHHGQEKAKQANVILPSTAFVEKKATYVNTKGKVQQTKPTTTISMNSRDDQQIVKALFNFIWPQNNLSSRSFTTKKITKYNYQFQQDLNLFSSGSVFRTPSQNIEFSSIWNEGFSNIAPHLMLVENGEKKQKIINKKKLVSEETHNLIFNSFFEPLFDNFYLSNIISQNSVIMGKCSNTFKKRSSFII